MSASSLTVGAEFPKGVKLVYVPYDKDNESQGTCGAPFPFDLDRDLAGHKVVIVAVPGAFTPTCSENHIPPFIQNASALKAKGVHEVIVLSANDPFVLEGWAKALKGYNDYFKFASDTNAKFAQSVGLSLDLNDKGLGIRTGRFAVIVDNGKVTYFGQDMEGASYEAVSAKL